MSRVARLAVLLALFALTLALHSGASSEPPVSSSYDPLAASFPEWERLHGPPGGYVERIEQCQGVPNVLYASGAGEGLYKSTDRGQSWTLLPSGDPGPRGFLLVDPGNPNRVVGWDDGLAESIDGGVTWASLGTVVDRTIRIQHVAADPKAPGNLYVAGSRHDRTGCSVFFLDGSARSWASLGPSGLPHRSTVAGLAAQHEGSLFLGINDQEFAESGRGQLLPSSSERAGGWTSRLFASHDLGKTWIPLDYGTHEPRFIWSLYVNPWEPAEVWVSEGPLFNESIDQPLLYRSTNNGRSWTPVFINASSWDSTQVRVLGASSDGSVYVAAGSQLLVTRDQGATFQTITPPREQMNGVDFFDIAIDAEDPETLFLPLRSGGIAYSEDAGHTWTRRDQGIATVSANLLEADPFNPGTLYVSSRQGQGVYRTDDYGETWSRSLSGIDHPWGDEIIADPHREGVLWFIADVPLVYQSTDFAATWALQMDPGARGSFNFGSIYAVAQGAATDTLFVADNGFGLFRGEGGTWDGTWDWTFLRTSEIDYTYALTVDPSDDRILYSGYSSKPFQDFAMIRRSDDAGASWTTPLRIDGADAVTSIAVDSGSSATVFSASTGHPGRVWRSLDRGESWIQPNPLFNFTTIHTYAAAPSDARTAYAGIWGGGTFVTRDGGESWHALDSPAAFSAAGIAVAPNNAETVYIADRTAPVLFRSTDGGATFETLFDAGSGYARLMHVAIDPSAPGCVYTIAMKTLAPMDRAPGVHGSLFRIQDGQVYDVTGTLPRMPLSVTVDPSDSDRIFAVLHGYGVYGSDDGAGTWHELSGTGSGLPDSGFFSLIIDPLDASILYLVGGCDIRFGSFESGGLDPDLVNGIYRSVDGGRTWTPWGTGIQGRISGAVKALAFSATDPDLVLAAAENGLYTSYDRGSTWTLDTDLPYATLGGVALLGRDVLAMSNGAGVLRGRLSAGGSIGWDADPVLVASVAFAQVVVDGQTPGRVFASGYPGGVFRSLDQGVTWHEANFGLPSFAVDDPARQGYYALALAPSDSSILYLGLYGIGLYKSLDGAGTWMPMNGRQGTLVGEAITALAIDPKDANRATVASEDGVYRTSDGGGTWTPMNRGLPTTDVKTLHMTPSGVLFAGTRGYGLYRWNGSTWQAQNPVGEWGVIWPMWADRPRYQYSDLLLHADNGNRMMFGCFPAGIYVSEDAGATWRERNVGWTQDGVFSLVSQPGDPNIVYAGTYNGVNRSLDFGEHWEAWDAGWPAEQWVFRVAFDPRDPSIMYACSKNGENEGQGRDGFRGTVMKSLDGGAHWFAITNGLSLNQEFYDLVVDPLSPDVLYLAAQEEGMFISTDAGATWHPWNQGLDGKRPATNGNNVTRVLALSADHRYLYFGVVGAGVYRREIHPPMP